MLNFSTLPPISLYVHLPWCIKKCPYCDFNSHELRQNLPEEAYINALIRDLDLHLPLLSGRALVSVFFGGGTPSLFSPPSIERILSAIAARDLFKGPVEITLEANPGTIEAGRFRGFKAAGINRLSIGLQSLQDEKLQALGRIHGRDHALRAIEQAIEAGFDHFNLDLMHGLPGQTLQDAMGDLETALAFYPPHVSWYQLTIEPNTFFHARPPTLPDEEILINIQSAGIARLTKANLLQYEVSAFAKLGHECIHNKNYWEFGDYLGIGAGAHSKLTDITLQKITRHSQPKNPRDYMSEMNSKTPQEKILTKADIIFEFMLNALRLAQGVPIELFTTRTGLTTKALSPYMKEAIDRKLLVDCAEVLCPTDQGRTFLNDLIGIFLPLA